MFRIPFDRSTVGRKGIPRDERFDGVAEELQKMKTQTFVDEEGLNKMSTAELKVLAPTAKPSKTSKIRQVILA